ncbi:hypothetical protein OPT61_g315 [Boeremia exigua]|uniref:Uncharacterized protein n=1 Tax=Boeremia exigua TaxID=749465 RepID=A0ACC2IUE9_9PLEO|nr:hypothetical protein OPT61_g315 [Boeremia exigua]
MRDRTQFVKEETFKVLMWTFCGISSAFLASRLGIRLFRREKFKRSDGLLLLALPSLLAGSALLHSSLSALYNHSHAGSRADHEYVQQHEDAAPRLTAATELLWITIYSVKASFLLQFKFHKPPYSLVSVNLTRYYWTTVGMCTAAFICTLAVPPILCPSSSECQYLEGASSNTRAWEISLVSIDIVTDIAVMLIPILLIRMGNFTLSHAVVNTVFKSLSVCVVAIAAIRLAFLCNGAAQNVDYGTVILWLMVEAAVAVTAASISSYRVIVLDYLCKSQVQRARATQRDGCQPLNWWRTRGPCTRGQDHGSTAADSMSVILRPID